MLPAKRSRRDAKEADIGDYNSDGGFVEMDDDHPKSKKAKATKPSKLPTKTANSSAPDDKEPFWELSSSSKNVRRAGIQQFKNSRLVSIREYYQDTNGKYLPGKKGISLSIDQYTELLKAIPEINAALGKMGEAINAADDVASSEDEQVPAQTRVKTKSSKAKANIEATSDEDED